MGQTLSELISQALSKAREEVLTRENSITITKLQEALMWHHMDEQERREAARRVGFGAQMEPIHGSTSP